MSEEKYNVVFTGDVIKGMDREIAKQNFSNAFNVTGMKLDALFSGKPVVLKKGVDYPGGMKYRGQLKRLGMISSINPVQDKESNAEVSQSLNNQSGKIRLDAHILPTPEIETGNPTDKTEYGDWSLAPPGSDLNQIKDSRDPVQVDISNLTVAPLGSDLLVDKPEKQLVNVDTSGIKLIGE